MQPKTTLDAETYDVDPTDATTVEKHYIEDEDGTMAAQVIERRAPAVPGGRGQLHYAVIYRYDVDEEHPDDRVLTGAGTLPDHGEPHSLTTE
jgi:hypothetical protein